MLRVLKSYRRIILTLVFVLISSVLYSNPTEIHSIHAPFGIRSGTSSTSNIIFRHLYTVSTNEDIKFLDWIAYRLTGYIVQDAHHVGRDYVTDPLLDESETLEERSGRGDYTGSHRAYSYERGHMIPRAAVEGSRYGDEEVNYLSIFAPQTTSLNQGPWKRLEDQVQELVLSGQEVFVLAGPFYEMPAMPELPEANEPHTVPNGYWMVVYDRDYNVAGFLMSQDVSRSANPTDFVVSIDDVEARTGFDLFSNLEDTIENHQLEGQVDPSWSESWGRS